MRQVFFFILAGALSLVGCAAFAQPPMREQLVYSLTAFNGSTYSESFAPQSEDTIYLIANVNNIISPRKTIVYYWPITRRYMTDFSTLNEGIPGRLEVLRRGRVIATFKRQKYALHYYPDPEGHWSEKTALCLGEEADAYYGKYKEAVTEFNQKFREYTKAMQVYREELSKFYEEIRRRMKAGESIDDVPVPEEPSPPDFVEFYVSEPALGFVVNLPPGHYEIRVKLDDNTILEGSEKKLVVFTSRRAGGVGYEIIPGNRWTERENCDDPSWIIHAVGKNELYFNPFMQEEYNEFYHNKLQDPQNIGRIERWKWVHTELVKNVTLLFSQGRKVLETVNRTPYLVREIRGPEPDGTTVVGYEIMEYSEDLKESGYKRPTFEGYKINVGLELSGTDYTVCVMPGKGRIPLPGSERTIRILRKENSVYLYPVALLPLVVGAIAVVGRRTRIKT